MRIAALSPRVSTCYDGCGGEFWLESLTNAATYFWSWALNMDKLWPCLGWAATERLGNDQNHCDERGSCFPDTFLPLGRSGGHGLHPFQRSKPHVFRRRPAWRLHVERSWHRAGAGTKVLRTERWFDRMPSVGTRKRKWSERYHLPNAAERNTRRSWCLDLARRQ